MLLCCCCCSIDDEKIDREAAEHQCKHRSCSTRRLPLTRSGHNICPQCTAATILAMSSLSNDTKDSTFSSRSVQLAVLAREQGEGMGARVRRSIGRPELRTLDPFFNVGRISSGVSSWVSRSSTSWFPRLFLICIQNPRELSPLEDFKGNKGNIAAGDLQWMTAGKGIVHSEVPLDSRVCRGLQLWINLKSSDKMCEPRYQEVSRKRYYDG